MTTNIMYVVEPEKTISNKSKWFLNKYYNDEDFRNQQRQYINQWFKNKYQNDEEYRNRKKAYAQRKRDEKKAHKLANSP